MLKGTLKSGYPIDHAINDRSKKPTSKKPENVEMHERINKRTAKHEAAMILIEALNTLLNE